VTFDTSAFEVGAITADTIVTGAEQLRAVLAEVLAEAPEPVVLEP
jgi:hypothetical protein